MKPLHGINGRLRQHIHNLGRHYAVGHGNRQQSHTNADNGSGSESGGRNAWIRKYRDSLLDKADNVFFAQHGRFPMEQEDFPVKVRQICENLDRNWNYYDTDLDRMRREIRGREEDIAAAFSSGGSATLGARSAKLERVHVAPWQKVLLAIGVTGGISGFVGIFIGVPQLAAVGFPAIFLTAPAWAGPNYRCSSCRKGYDSVPKKKVCKKCRLEFDR